MKNNNLKPIIADAGEKCECGYQFTEMEGAYADKYSDQIMICKNCVKKKRVER